MADSSYANFKAFEGSLSTAVTLTFDWRPRSLTIVNDGNADLQFKFNSGEDYATLKAGETVAPDIITRSVYLNSTGTSYRVWGIG